MDQAKVEFPSSSVILLYAIGIGSLVSSLVTANGTGPSGDGVFQFHTLVQVLLSAGLVIATAWVDRSDMTASDERRVAMWCVGGILAMSTVGLFATIISHSGSVMGLGIVFADLVTGGALVGVLIGVYDADQQRSKRELAVERERSANISRRLQILNRVLRHDIRNDLNVIAGYADMLTAEDAAVTELATAIERKSTEVVELSDQARDIERSFSRGEPDLRPVDIAEILRTEADRIERDYVGVDITTDLPDHCWVYASKLIGSAIDNVIENAAEHGDQPSTDIRISIDRPTEAVVSIRIADDGPGIPESELEALDTEADHALRHSSGLGLWLVNWIVEESDGRMRFDENDPRGTIVMIELPSVQKNASGQTDLD